MLQCGCDVPVNRQRKKEKDRKKEKIKDGTKIFSLSNYKFFLTNPVYEGFQHQTSFARMVGLGLLQM